MPIPFVCPSCATRLRAPDDRAGRKTKCPKCGTLTLVPAQPRPEPAPASIQVGPISQPAPLVTCPHCGQTMAEDRRFAGQAVGCLHCGGALRMHAPAQTVPSAAPAAPSPAPFDRPGADEDDTPGRSLGRREGPEASAGLGIGSLVLGIIALLFSGSLGIFSLPLSGAGLLLGVIGGIVAVSRGGSGIGLPIAGSALNAAALAVALVSLGLESHF